MALSLIFHYAPPWYSGSVGAVGRTLIICRIRAKSCGVGREIQLSGGEITILKAIGLSGTTVPGKFLIDKIEEVEAGEFIDTLGGLLAMGYLLATKAISGGCLSVRLLNRKTRAFRLFRYW